MVESAKFILSKKKLMDQYNIIKNLCDIVSYSAKTNYEVAQVLEDLTDCMFSMHTGESLSKVKDKNRIWFFAQAWNFLELKELFEFGMFSYQISKLIPELRKNKNIEKLGIHFHRKTQNVSEWNLKFELENVLTDETLNDIDLLNIGGGIPIKYKNFRADVLNSIYKEIKGLREFLDKYNIKLIIEPGRFISGP